MWRDLDWLVDDDKVPLDCSEREDLQRGLLQVFRSQTGGGKRYDLAALGRRRAHATFHESHAVDAREGLVFAADLTPLIEAPDLDAEIYMGTMVERFADDVRNRIRRMQ